MQHFYGISGSNDPPALRYVIGVLLGDGSCWETRSMHYRTGQPSITWRIELAVKDREFAEAFADALTKILRRPDSPNRIIKVLKGRNASQAYRVLAASKSFGEWWQDMKTDLARLQPVITRYPALFLQGLYDSEGNLSHHRTGPIVRIFNQRQDILALAIYALNLLGMRAHIRVFRPSGTIVHFPNGITHTTTKALYVIDPKPARAFLGTIGSSIPRKRLEAE